MAILKVYNGTDWVEVNVTDAATIAALGAVMDTDFTTDGLMTRTASGVYTSRTITGSTSIDVTDGDGDAGNPTLDTVQRYSIEDNGSGLELDGDELKPAAYKVYSVSSVAGNREWALHRVTPPLCFASTSASSGNQYLKHGYQNGQGGVDGYVTGGMPWAADLVAVTLTTEITSYTSGTAELVIYAKQIGAGYTTLHTITGIAITGTGQYLEHFTFSMGTHTVSAGGFVGAKFDLNNSGVMTADDTCVDLYFSYGADI